MGAVSHLVVHHGAAVERVVAGLDAPTQLRVVHLHAAVHHANQYPGPVAAAELVGIGLLIRFSQGWYMRERSSALVGAALARRGATGNQRRGGGHRR